MMAIAQQRRIFAFGLLRKILGSYSVRDLRARSSRRATLLALR
jgi:hypothetical protein